MNLEKLSTRYRSVNPYRPGEGIEELAQRLGVKPSDILKLNANENLFLSRSYVTDLVKQAADELDPRLYPQKEGEQLKKSISELHRINPDGIILASGGDQLIEGLLSALLNPWDPVKAVAPTFSMYPRTCMVKGLDYSEIKIEKDFTLNSGKILSNTQESGAIVLCNPNNPTGNQFSEESVMELIEGYGGIVILDEAYAEYGKYTLVKEAEKRSNLVIIRTFSKAYGLAGLRLGYAVTNNELAAIINERYMMPYPVSSLTLKIGVKALQNHKFFEEKIKLTKEAREELAEDLNNLKGVKAFPSDANFILFNTPKKMEYVYSMLLERGIILRKIGDVPGHRECLRVTVAPPHLNLRFTSALEEVLK